MRRHNSTSILAHVTVYWLANMLQANMELFNQTLTLAYAFGFSVKNFNDTAFSSQRGRGTQLASQRTMARKGGIQKMELEGREAEVRRCRRVLALLCLATFTFR